MIVIVECPKSWKRGARTSERYIRSKFWWASTEAARWYLDYGVSRHDGPGGTRS